MPRTRSEHHDGIYAGGAKTQVPGLVARDRNRAVAFNGGSATVLIRPARPAPPPPGVLPRDMGRLRARDARRPIVAKGFSWFLRTNFTGEWGVGFTSGASCTPSSARRPRPSPGLPSRSPSPHRLCRRFGRRILDAQHHDHRVGRGIRVQQRLDHARRGRGVGLGAILFFRLRRRRDWETEEDRRTPSPRRKTTTRAWRTSRGGGRDRRGHRATEPSSAEDDAAPPARQRRTSPISARERRSAAPSPSTARLRAQRGARRALAARHGADLAELPAPVGRQPRHRRRG